jgi:anti-sigma B factor antagonist
MSSDSKLIVRDVDGTTVVSFGEEAILDTMTIQRIGDELDQLVDAQSRWTSGRNIILDFSAVRFLSSAALGVLLSMRKKSQAIDTEVMISSLRPELFKIFQVTRIDKLFQFFDSTEEAVSASSST